MSKSLGNYIGVTDAPAEMFGKSMSIPDSLMEKYFTLLTDVPDEEIRSLLSGHPREAKIALARTLVASYWGEDAAEQAQTGFDRMFREGGLPDQIPEVQIPGALLRDGSVLLAAALASAGLCATNSEGRRLIQGGAVRVDTWRRMLYQERMRRVDDKMFTAFDFPDCGQVRAKRPVSTTPLQALNLMNSAFVREQAQRLASRAEEEASTNTPEARIRRAFQLVLNREPDGDELAACEEVSEQVGLAMVCRSLINTNEFAFLP